MQNMPITVSLPPVVCSSHCRPSPSPWPGNNWSFLQFCDFIISRIWYKWNLARRDLLESSCITQRTSLELMCVPALWLLWVKNLPASAGDTGDAGSIPGSERSPREGNGNPLQYSFLEGSMDRGDWQATVLEVTKSWIWLSMRTYVFEQLHFFSRLHSANLN